MSSSKKYSLQIKTKAKQLGFAACGIAKAENLEAEEPRLKNYLENNYHGKMAYMARHFEKRLNPTLLLEGAKSVVVVLLNYFPNELQKGQPLISKYAYGKDYHFVLKEKLNELLQYINAEIAPCTGRAFVDSAPVLERAWAVKAGLGWIGKNGLLINRELGSFFFIAELVIDLELDYDEAYAQEHCGTCSQCLSACPTKALIQPYTLDSNKCISYLTIELKEDIPEVFKPMLANRAYGCDICQDVCPWNRKPTQHIEDDFIPHPSLLSNTKENWQNLSRNDFNEIFRKSAVKRAGFEKFKQNINNAIVPKELF